MHGGPGPAEKGRQHWGGQHGAATFGLALCADAWADRTVTRAWTTKHGETASIGMRSADRDLRNVYERTSAASCGPSAGVAGFRFGARSAEAVQR